VVRSEPVGLVAYAGGSTLWGGSFHPRAGSRTILKLTPWGCITPPSSLERSEAHNPGLIRMKVTSPTGPCLQVFKRQTPNRKPHTRHRGSGKELPHLAPTLSRGPPILSHRHFIRFRLFLRIQTYAKVFWRVSAAGCEPLSHLLAGYSRGDILGVVVQPRHMRTGARMGQHQGERAPRVAI